MTRRLPVSSVDASARSRGSCAGVWGRRAAGRCLPPGRCWPLVRRRRRPPPGGVSPAPGPFRQPARYFSVLPAAVCGHRIDNVVIARMPQPRIVFVVSIWTTSTLTRTPGPSGACRRDAGAPCAAAWAVTASARPHPPTQPPQHAGPAARAGCGCGVDGDSRSGVQAACHCFRPPATVLGSDPTVAVFALRGLPTDVRATRYAIASDGTRAEPSPRVLLAAIVGEACNDRSATTRPGQPDAPGRLPEPVLLAPS